MRLELATNMDSGNSSKRRKSSESEGEDIISNLPDSVIGHILSLVPTQDAVRTCVLSKRWKYLWTFITNLFFQDRAINTPCKLHRLRDSLLFFIRHRKQHYTSNENQPFLNLVNGVMMRLNDSSIYSFTLIISDIYDPSHVNEWISAVLHRRIKKLCVYSHEKFTLPSYSLLQFLSMEELVLMLGSCTVRVPNSACFRSLTVLRLNGITLTRDSSNNSENLTLKFPVLREFVTLRCTWSGIESVTLEAPLLEDVKILSHYGKSPSIKFCVSHLTKFTFVGFLSPAPWLLDLSATNIASANILLVSPGKLIGEEERIQACEILKQFTSNVECLRFSWSRTMVVEQAEDSLAEDSLADLPASKTLSCLKLDFVTIEILLGLLLRAPLLKTLIIGEVLFQFHKELLNSATVPDCFRSNLKIVELGCFGGSEHQMSFGKFVMENAQVLEKIRFRLDSSLSHSKIDEVKKKLFLFKKACSTAIIEFC